MTNRLLADEFVRLQSDRAKPVNEKPQVLSSHCGLTQNKMANRLLADEFVRLRSDRAKPVNEKTAGF